MVDRPATTSTLVTVASGQDFGTSLLPTAVGNATKVFDADSALTDTSISGAYIDDIWLRYSKRVNRFMAPVTATQGTYSANGTTCIVTMTAGHNFEKGQELFLDFLTYSSGTSPKDDEFTVLADTNHTGTTFAVTIPAFGAGTITGNVDVYLPTNFCFYLVSTGTVTNINQFFPLFVASLPSTPTYQTCSLSMKGVLPFINHPAVQAGNNVTSTNSNIALKNRGLMLKRGQALYVAVSGATALTNGFYCNVQGGYY